MNKRSLILIAGIATLIVVVAAYFLGRNLASTSIFNLSSPIATNFRYPYQISSTEAYYFNGSTFMSLNLQNQTSKALTPFYSLPNVVAIKWSSTGALFQATNYGSYDQLQPILRSKHLPLNASYWWRVEFSTGTISLVGSPSGPSSDTIASNGTTVTDSVWAKNGQSYYYLQVQNLVGKPFATSLYQGAAIGNDSLITPTNATSLLWSDGSRLITKTDVGSKHSVDQIDLGSKQTHVLSSAATGPVFVASDGQNYLQLAIQTGSNQEGFSGASGLLQLTNLGGGKPRSIAAQFSGNATWSQDGSAWVALETNGTGKNRVASGFMDNGSGKIQRLVIKPLAKQTLPQNLRVVGYEGDQILLIDSSNNAYIAASDLPNFTAVQPFQPNNWNISGTSNLISHGVSNIQLQDLEYALYQYARSTSTNIESISFTNTETGPRGKVNSIASPVINFDATINQGKPLKARMEYTSLTSVRLYLSDKSGKAIYDSGVISEQNLN